MSRPKLLSCSSPAEGGDWAALLSFAASYPELLWNMPVLPAGRAAELGPLPQALVLKACVTWSLSQPFE